MHGELKRRFEYVTNSSTRNFDPIYVTATMLHPAYRELLQTDQIEAGKAHLLEILQQLKPAQISANADIDQQEQNENSTDQHSCTEETELPQPKRFKHITVLLAEKRKQCKLRRA